MRKEFFSVFYALTDLSFGIKDRYFVSRLKSKSEKLLTFLAKEGGQTSVAQCREKRDQFLELLKEIDEFVDLLIHLKSCPISPALQAKKQVLILHIKAFDFYQPPRPFMKKIEKEKEPVKSVKKEENHTRAIAGFIIKRGKCQMREIVHAFKNQLSPRTVQRHVEKMIKSGELSREIVDGYPKYSAH